MVMGDFNARYTQLDNATNPRGEVLADWAAGLDLKLVNICTLLHASEGLIRCGCLLGKY